MNQKLLGILRMIGYIFFFAICSGIISAIPDALTSLPYVGGLVTPTLSLAITGFLAAQEHALADKWGYNIPAGAVRSNR